VSSGKLNQIRAPPGAMAKGSGDRKLTVGLPSSSLPTSERAGAVCRHRLMHQKPATRHRAGVMRSTCYVTRGRRAGRTTWVSGRHAIAYRNRSLWQLACLAPPNRGHLNSNHVLGTHVPVEEPSTASESEVNAVHCFQPASRSASGTGGVVRREGITLAVRGATMRNARFSTDSC
jgi:hypothetical protein